MKLETSNLELPEAPGMAAKLKEFVEKEMNFMRERERNAVALATGSGGLLNANPMFATAVPLAILAPMPTLEADATQPWRISQHGNVAEIFSKFDGADHLRDALRQLHSLMHPA